MLRKGFVQAPVHRVHHWNNNIAQKLVFVSWNGRYVGSGAGLCMIVVVLPPLHPSHSHQQCKYFKFGQIYQFFWRKTFIQFSNIYNIGKYFVSRRNALRILLALSHFSLFRKNLIFFFWEYQMVLKIEQWKQIGLELHFHFLNFALILAFFEDVDGETLYIVEQGLQLELATFTRGIRLIIWF